MGQGARLLLPLLLLLLLQLGALTVVAGRPDSTTGRVSYSGYKLLGISAGDENAWRRVMKILEAIIPEKDIDVWKEPSRREGEAHVLLSPEHRSSVTAALQRDAVPSRVLIDDVQSLIQTDDDRLPRRVRRSVVSVVGRYAKYEEVMQWMDYMAKQYPKFAFTFEIGETIEGRSIKVLRLRTPGQNKKKIWIDGCMHAREWISTATVVYLIQQFSRGYESDADIRLFLEQFDWYFVPIVNPDGYVYSHEINRFWRKNRRVISDECVGVDLNRNWDFKWGGRNTVTNPCSSLYRGEQPQSEREVRHVAAFLLARAGAFIAFFSLHSYGQVVLTRWAYDKDASPPLDHQQVLSTAQQIAAAMTSVHNVTYLAGTAPELLYTYSGGSGDWAKGRASIKYAYTMELRDRGMYGFALPASQILPVGEEVMAGLRLFGRQLLQSTPLVDLISSAWSTQAPTAVRSTTTHTTRSHTETTERRRTTPHVTSKQPPSEVTAKATTVAIPSSSITRGVRSTPTATTTDVSSTSLDPAWKTTPRAGLSPGTTTGRAPASTVRRTTTVTTAMTTTGSEKPVTDTSTTTTNRVTDTTQTGSVTTHITTTVPATMPAATINTTLVTNPTTTPIATTHITTVTTPTTITTNTPVTTHTTVSTTAPTTIPITITTTTTNTITTTTTTTTTTPSTTAASPTTAATPTTTTTTTPTTASTPVTTIATTPITIPTTTPFTIPTTAPTAVPTTVPTTTPVTSTTTTTTGPLTSPVTRPLSPTRRLTTRRADTFDRETSAAGRLVARSSRCLFLQSLCIGALFSLLSLL